MPCHELFDQQSADYKNKILKETELVVSIEASETNFWKSIPLKFFAKILPSFKVSGKGIIKVQASDNVKMLKELSMDDLFIHKPTFRSLQGVVDLMDEAYKDTEEYFKNY